VRVPLSMHRYGTAHTTYFAEPGWKYLKHGAGSGWLSLGGSYVTLTDGTELTLIVEKMAWDHSVCIRPSTPQFQTENETAVFQLPLTFAGKTLCVGLHGCDRGVLPLAARLSVMFRVECSRDGWQRIACWWSQAPVVVAVWLGRHAASEFHVHAAQHSGGFQRRESDT